MASDPAVQIDVAGWSVECSSACTHTHKVFFSERGESKLDLIGYHLALEQPGCRGHLAGVPFPF